MRRFPVWIAAGLLAAALVAPRSAAAQGYGVYEQGACTMGRAGAAVASPCDDGSAIFFNPAGIVGTGSRISVGGTLIGPSGDFTNDFTGRVSELENNIYPVPSVYATTQVGDRYAVGIGLFAPYGLTTEWPTTAEGRFLGHFSKIAGVYVQPTAAMRITDRISVGAGLDVTFVSVGLEQRVDLSEQLVPGGGGITFANLGIPEGTDFANVDLTGHATSLGYHVGVHAKVHDRISLGARYLSRQKIEIDDGEAVIDQIETGIVLAPGNPLSAGLGLPADQPLPLDPVLAGQFGDAGPLADQGGATILRFPEQFVIGTALQLTDEFKFLFDYQYTEWSVFGELPITFDRLGTVVLREDYEGVSGWRFGGEYLLSPGTTLRAGYDTHGAASPPQTVTPNLPEGPRSEFTVGFGTKFGGNLMLDLAYMYIDQADRRGRSTDGGLAVPTVDVNNGVYRFHAHLFGATFTYAF